MRQHQILRKRCFAQTLLSLAFVLLLVFASLPQPVAASVTLQYPIAASTDDGTKYSTTLFSTTLVEERIGTYGATVYNDNGLRFLNVSIDSSYSLYYAKLIFTAAATQAGIKPSTIYYEDNVTPATFSTIADFNARTRGAFSQSWTVPSVTAEQQYEVDVTILVAAIGSNASWTSGNNMTFFWTSGSETTPKRFYSYNGDPAKAPILEIKYKESFYATFYCNQDDGGYGFLSGLQGWNYMFASGNGTQWVFQEEEALEFWTALNGSYVFQNYTITDHWTYTNNPTSTAGTWTNGSDAYTSNDIYATADPFTGTKTQNYTNFNYNIPESAIIEQIIATIEYNLPDDKLYFLFYNTTNQIEIIESFTTPTAEDTIYSEDITNLDTWTPNTINNIVLRLQATSLTGLPNTIYVDHIHLTITYTKTTITYTDNPLLWTMPENFGNTTIWAYTAEIATSNNEYFILGLLGGSVVVGAIGLVAVLAIKRRD